MLQRALVLGSLILLAPMAWAQVTVTGAPGATLKKLAGTPTLVTVVLRPSGAEDRNLQILEVHADRVTVLTSKNEPIPYLFESIQEIHVQGGVIEERELSLKANVLPKAEQEIVDRALARALELFNDRDLEQELNIELAAVLSLAGHQEAKDYLAQRVDSNDLEVQLEANLAQYLAGGEINEKLVRTGLESGVRAIRGNAAMMAGLAQFTALSPSLSAMMQDRTPEIAQPAARALGRLQQRDAIPYLISMAGSSSGEKGDAALWALNQLGGDDLIAQLKLRLNTAEGLERFRIAQVLYHLEDPLGRKIILQTIRDVPTLRLEAALIVAWKEGDWDAKEILRAKLQKREDVNDRNLVSRARTAGALVSGGDPQAKAVLQEILRSDSELAREQVFKEITRLGNYRLLSLMRSSIENPEPRVAVSATRTAVSIGYPAFRERLMASWE